MKFPRESGLLLHPTSLPGPYGIGEIGPEAKKFIRQLKKMGQHLWQVLPLGPTSFGDSPYQALSAFAGNTLLISLDLLEKDGLLSKAQIKKLPTFDDSRVDYGYVIPERTRLLNKAAQQFGSRASDGLKKKFDKFCKTEAFWLDDYALFIAIKEANEGRPWVMWDEALVRRDPKALKQAERKYKATVRNTKILQFLFFKQWHELRKYAHSNGVHIIGDIPIFVAHDSADVWAKPELFFLKEDGHPEVVAGVPPDYFSATGQLWGNPLYNWEKNRETDYAWWAQRIAKSLELVDYLRIDHFRGFEANWEIPAGEKTAMNGKWVKGPSHDLFNALERHLGKMPIIAEDLGVITPEVEDLRDDFKFPGMRILQFAFGNDDKADDYRPENYPENCVVYTGTHDNDTTVGWFWSNAGEGTTRSQEEIDAERSFIMHYLQTDGSEIHWDLIALAMNSRANTVVFPVQDLLGLGTEARMNVPGREAGNWGWRLKDGDLTQEIISRLDQLSSETGRKRKKSAKTKK